tara:strand:- start:58 stop:444 length:387 start_codon:yes stop_codon:yes gene_type:complete
MKTIEANKLIVKLQKDIAKSGIVKEQLVKDLKALRPYALAEEDPTLTKVIRLTYEHVENTGTFNIPIPADEAILEGEEDVEAEVETMDMEDFENKRMSLDYLLSLMLDRDNVTNQQDLCEYRDMLKAY